MIFDCISFDIDGPVLIKPKIFADARGYFFESFAKKDLEKAGIWREFVQDNQAYSTLGTLRGLHFQSPPYEQSKLVRVSQGKALDIAVDLRPQSVTYGRYISAELNDQNHHILFIPKGFAHGYLVLSETCMFQYKCDQYYRPDAQGGILYNDPTIGIEWPTLDFPFIISEKDQQLPLLQ